MTFGQNDPDSNIFQYCMPSGQADTATPGAPAPTTKRQRPDPQAKFRGGRRHPFGPSSQQAPLPSAPIQDPTLRLTSKLLLRHEEALAMQRKEKNFALFFRQDQRSLLPNLMKISRDWNERKDAGDQPLESPLRTVLLGCLLKELLARLQQVVATEPGRAALLKSKWIDDQGAWRYMRWSPKEKRLVVDETREAPEAARVLGSLHSLMRGSIIQRFSSTMALWKLGYGKEYDLLPLCL